MRANAPALALSLSLSLSLRTSICRPLGRRITRSLPPSAALREIHRSTSLRREQANRSSVPSDCAARSTGVRRHRRRNPRPVRPAPALQPRRACVRGLRHRPVESPVHSEQRASAHIERSRAHKRGSTAIARSTRHLDAPAALPHAAQSANRTLSNARLAASAGIKYPEKTAQPPLPAGGYWGKNK